MSTTSRTSASPMVNLSVMDAAFLLRQAAVDLGGEPHQRVRHLDRIGCARLERAQAARGRRSRSRAARARISASVGDGPTRRPSLHDQLDQRLAGLRVALERQDIAGHPAVRAVAAPDLLAARPGRLAGRALAPRQPGIFLQLVGAVERRHVGRRRQAGADAEAVDRRAGSQRSRRRRPRRGRRWRRSSRRQARRRRGCGARSSTAR